MTPFTSPSTTPAVSPGGARARHSEQSASRQAGVPVQRVLTVSKSRPRQMHILARALTDRYDVTFTAAYEEHRHEWRMDWCSGPTEDEVRGAISRLAAGLPAVTSLRVYRGYSDLDQAAALLKWLDADPSRLTGLSTWNVDEAFAQTRYPEQAGDAWIWRAKRLLEVGYLHTAGLSWLRGRTWPQAVAELDAAQEAPTLNATALDRLSVAGISVADWARLNFMSSGEWCGDVCGCPDSRCIGYHHFGPDDCECIVALLGAVAGSSS